MRTNNVATMMIAAMRGLGLMPLSVDSMQRFGS